MIESPERFALCAAATICIFIDMHIYAYSNIYRYISIDRYLYISTYIYIYIYIYKNIYINIYVYTHTHTNSPVSQWNSGTENTRFVPSPVRNCCIMFAFALRLRYMVSYEGFGGVTLSNECSTRWDTKALFPQKLRGQFRLDCIP